MNSNKALFCNILILSGLAMVSVGLYFSFGPGPAIGAPGLFFICFGVWGLVR